MSKWTREGIIRELLRREAAGLPLVHTKKPGQGVEPTLYAAGVRIFGSWRSVLLAAGIAPELGQFHQRWSIPKVLGIIRSLAQRRRRLKPEEIRQRYGNVDEAARRFFGSWPKAILAAGVDPAKILRIVPWAKERLIEAILTRVLHGKPLGRHSVSPSSLVDVAVRVFGSWDAALAAAGLDPKAYADREEEVPTNGSSHGRRQSDGMVSASHSQGEQGEPPANPPVPTGPATAPVKQLPKTPTGWSDQAIIDAILALRQGQQSLDVSWVQKEQRPLHHAATKRYGNWRNALRAAGLNPEEFRKSQKVSPAR